MFLALIQDHKFYFVGPKFIMILVSPNIPFPENFQMCKCYPSDLVVKSDHGSPQCISNLFYIQIFMCSNYVNLAISNLFIFIHFHHDLQRSIES